MTYLVGLNGRRGAGKDTAFSFIYEWGQERGVSVGRRGFADAMKLSFARIFIPDVSIDEAVIFCDMIKGEGQAKLQIEWGNFDTDDAQKSFVRHELTGRLALQRYGTEAHRDVFGEDFWVDVLLPLERLRVEVPHRDDGLEAFMDEPSWPRNFMGQLDQEPPQLCVITDTRFESEVRRVRDLGGKVWEVHRGFQKLNDNHLSELPLPPDMIDLTIYNNAEGDFHEMVGQLRAALDKLVAE